RRGGEVRRDADLDLERAARRRALRALHDPGRARRARRRANLVADLAALRAAARAGAGERAMRAWLQRARRAVRAFRRGFTGLASPPPKTSRALHEHLDRRERGRTPCC